MQQRILSGGYTIELYEYNKLLLHKPQNYGQLGTVDTLRVTPTLNYLNKNLTTKTCINQTLDPNKRLAR